MTLHTKVSDEELDGQFPSGDPLYGVQQKCRDVGTDARWCENRAIGWTSKFRLCAKNTKKRHRETNSTRVARV